MRIAVWLAAGAGLLAQGPPVPFLTSGNVAPELGAHALLRIAAKTGSPEEKREWLEEAFRLAGKAQYRAPLALVPGVNAETRSAVRAQAISGLDALSLQSQALMALAAFDPPKGRTLLATFGRPAPTEASCEDSVLPDVTPYFAVVGKLAPPDAVLGALNSIHGVGELRAAAKMVSELDWPAVQYGSAIASLESAMGVMSEFSEFRQPDSRTFLTWVRDLDPSISSIAGRARQKGLATENFTKAYRAFLVRQFRADRCNDTDTPVMERQPADGKEIFQGEAAGGLPELGVQEMTPRMIQGEMTLVRYWQSATGEALQARARKAKDLGAEEFSQLLTAVEVWPGDGDDADVFHQKALLLEMLLDAAPDGEIASRVIAAYTQWLARKSVWQEQNAAEWSWHARRAIKARSLAIRQSIANAFAASGNPSLQLEAALADIP